MKSIYSDEELAVPEGVTVTIKARSVHVKGPRGELSKVRLVAQILGTLAQPRLTVYCAQHVKHINMDIKVLKNPKQTKVKFVVWHGVRKHNACLRTVKSLVENMIIGVTKGFQYKVTTALFQFFKL